ncbi:EspA/EspE family type VII secretion system effector [Mycobacterium sp. pV006]|uniref:EspA/EspE family type VII secretion system effector n=1 Tax=Mycobacterium sp. pV006 TaxID=3238983 RepID=UPI00351BB562
MDLMDLFGQSGKAALLSAPVAPDMRGADGQSSGSAILRAGQTLLAGMRSTAGWGDPDQGDQFTRAVSHMQIAGRTLAGARPGADWAGAAAQVYSDANQDLTGRTELLGALDNRVRQVISAQAYRISGHRETLARQSDFLADVGHATRALSAIPGVGPAAQASVEMAAVTSAVQLSEQDLRLLTDEVSDNAAQLDALAARYDDLAPEDTAPTPDPDAAPGKELAESDRDETPLAAGPPGPSPSGALPPAAVPAGAPPEDPVAGMTAAFSAVGGMIGAVVAPLSAALTGTLGTAVQALGPLADAGSAAERSDEATISDPAATADLTERDEAERDEADRDAADRDDTDESARDAEASADPATPSPQRPPVTPDDAPAPAATRPPR